jgi:hypothetical protein
MYTGVPLAYTKSKIHKTHTEKLHILIHSTIREVKNCNKMKYPYILSYISNKYEKISH